MPAFRARRGALLLALAVASGLLFTSSAAAKIHLRVSPARPYVDDDVTVSWRTDRVLKSGYGYRVEVSAPFGDGCVQSVTHTSRRGRKGVTVRLNFSPVRKDGSDTFLTEWCWGEGVRHRRP